MSNLHGKKILIGVTGGIAIYKVLDLISRLKKEGAELRIIMTKAATALVNPQTFQTMARCPVHTEMFKDEPTYDVEHIELAEDCDLALVAPATANTIAKLACGIADNLLTTTLLACKKPVYFAPAMNTNMLHHPATQRNIAMLREMGYGFIDSNSGFLACNIIGDGRMAEPQEIVEFLKTACTEKDLCGLRIMVTAGPTIERIDPVRYITNDSSGKMGYAIAKAALDRGAEVLLVSGPTSLEVPSGVQFTSVTTNEELYQAIDRDFEGIDVLIMAAAPADFRSEVVEDQKIKKKDALQLQLVKNRDIIGDFGQKKTHQTLIGFAAETEELVENAREKLRSKRLDYIVANDVSEPDSGFNVDTNRAVILSEKMKIALPLMLKREMADRILDLLKR